jgi:hypothetical protein
VESDSRVKQAGWNRIRHNLTGDAIYNVQRFIQRGVECGHLLLSKLQNGVAEAMEISRRNMQRILRDSKCILQQVKLPVRHKRKGSDRT